MTTHSQERSLRDAVFDDRDSDPSAILLLSPVMSATGKSACPRLLTPMALSSENVFVITYRQSADHWLRQWRDRTGARAANMVIISMEESPESIAGGPMDIPSMESDPEPVDADHIDTAVEHPDDLTGLGIYFSQHFDDWSDNDHFTVMCFDSLTSLLQYVDVRTAFRFLDVCTGRLRSSDAVGHFHMDPSAHDQQTVNRLKQLFDTVVEIEDDGSWTVATQ